MRAIMVMYDSLNRRMLGPYGCESIQTPNFDELARRSVTFDNAYVGSLPCMPARRELHTGRYNFLHRSWGPIEPFDDSMPEILKRNGIHSHLVSDHYHYWEDGGATYHNRYSTWEIVRGQEGDMWKGEVDADCPDDPFNARQNSPNWRQDFINRRHYQDSESTFPQAQTFAGGMEFIEKNHDADNWFLQIETFDPHEPYVASERFRQMYGCDKDEAEFDWPPYRECQETPEEIDNCRRRAAALHSMCDHYLGEVIKIMDKYDMWKDTMLIVNTDHGFLLSEHDCWAKCWAPFYDEVAHNPLFIWDPRGGMRGERRSALVQTIDLAPTVLDFFGLEVPQDMQGVPLKDTIASDRAVREAALFGIHGGHVNVTDGRYVYMRAPVNPDVNGPLHQYTLMPTHMREPFDCSDFVEVKLADPFSFTKGAKTMRIEARSPVVVKNNISTMLFDLEADPRQISPIDDNQAENRMIGLLDRLMRENDAPPEQWQRLGCEPHGG